MSHGQAMALVVLMGITAAASVVMMVNQLVARAQIGQAATAAAAAGQ